HHRLGPSQRPARRDRHAGENAPARAARSLLHRQLVVLVRPQDPGADAVRGHQPQRLLSDMPAPVIEVTRLSKKYRNVTAVDDVSFAVQGGQVTALLGGNGAGKTTTISMLLG